MRIAFLVYGIAVEANPGSTHQVIHEWVEEHTKRWKETFPEWSVPQFSRARDYIREIVNSATWLDSPWHLGLFASNNERDLPTEAVPDVAAVATRVFAGGKSLTGRQARWVARLRPLLGLIRGTDAHVQHAYSMAIKYASIERRAEAIRLETGLANLRITRGHESDTWPLDIFLISYDHLGFKPIGGYAMWGAYSELRDAGEIPPIPGSPVLSEVFDVPFTGIADTREVAELHLLLRQLPLDKPIDSDWSLVAPALIQLRLRASNDDWPKMRSEDKVDVALKIVNEVLDQAKDRPNITLSYLQRR